MSQLRNATFTTSHAALAARIATLDPRSSRDLHFAESLDALKHTVPRQHQAEVVTAVDRKIASRKWNTSTPAKKMLGHLRSFRHGVEHTVYPLKDAGDEEKTPVERTQTNGAALRPGVAGAALSPHQSALMSSTSLTPPGGTDSEHRVPESVAAQ